MNIVIDIGHPAQVHLFRNLAMLLEERGDRVLFTSVDKDITLSLFKEYHLDFVNLGPIGTTPLRKISRIPSLDWKFYQAVKRFQPDFFIGSASFRSAHVGAWLGKPRLSMLDTEMGLKEHWLYAPLTTWIATPHCFRRDMGRKQIRYNGFHELAYLHPKYFTPNPDVLTHLNLVTREPFFILRFVSWQATHDIGHKGLTLEQKRELVNYLKRHGRVVISSEGPLPEEFRRDEWHGKKTEFHDALAFAHMIITESHTVATEGAVLGVPVLRFGSFVGKKEMGNFIDLEQNHHLLRSFNDFPKMMRVLQEWLEQKNLKQTWLQRRDTMLTQMVDVNEWMLNFIDQHVRNKG